MEAVVQTSYGKVRGAVGNGMRVFLGIPYAAPPFGPRRFAPPSPPEPWDGVRDATTFGPTAPKPAYPAPYNVLLPDPEIPGEECLNLNIWAPEGERLPVMVWIHGGAFRNGSGAVASYNGANFARDGVVLVTINYRLGVEGFAYLPGAEAPANRGLRDQIEALTWVRDNIAAFGGDSGNVTVFGESAGAMSVSTLLSLDLGLFRRAIAQSGAGNIAQTPDDALLVTKEIAARLGVEPTAEGFATLDPDEIVPVQTAVSQEVAALPDPGRWGASTASAGMALIPVLDDELLTRRPEEAVASGAGRDVDLLIGYTAEEFRLFLFPTGVADVLTHELVGVSAAGMGAPPAVLDAYREAHPDMTAGELLATLITDALFRIPANRLAEGHGGRTWMYEFGWRSPLEGLGACHALELGFVFDNLDAPDTSELAGDDPPQQLADVMHKAWVDFAAHGAPGWEPFDLDGRPVKVFDGAANPIVSDPRGEDRKVW